MFIFKNSIHIPDKPGLNATFSKSKEMDLRISFFEINFIRIKVNATFILHEIKIFK